MQRTVFLCYKWMVGLILSGHAAHFFANDAVHAIGTNDDISIEDLPVSGMDLDASVGLDDFLDALIHQNLGLVLDVIVKRI